MACITKKEVRTVSVSYSIEMTEDELQAVYRMMGNYPLEDNDIELLRVIINDLSKLGFSRNEH